MDWLFSAFDEATFPLHDGRTRVLAMWTMASNLAIFIVYTTISALLMFFTLREAQSQRRRRGVGWFALFIFCSGVTYLIQALLFLWPLYSLLTIATVITALTSWSTVIVWLPMLLRRTTEEEHATINEVLARMEEMQAELKAREQRLNAVLSAIADIPHLPGRKPHAG